MCKQLAEWLIRDECDIHMFVCTEHLSQMVTPTTTSIERTDAGGCSGTTCDYLEPHEALREILDMWLAEWSGRPIRADNPFEWYQGVMTLVESMREALR